MIFDAENDLLQKECDKWAYYNHLKSVLPYYDALMQRYPHDKPPLFIRSNIYEIGRAYWKQECHDYNLLLELSGYNRKYNYSEDEKRIFRDFFIETDLTDVGIKGNNLLDFFYWEHRMGTWISEVLQETDCVFNTHCYVCCRKILELFLSISFEQRKNAAVFYRVIEKNGLFKDFPINPTKIIHKNVKLSLKKGKLYYDKICNDRMQNSSNSVLSEPEISKDKEMQKLLKQLERKDQEIKRLNKRISREINSWNYKIGSIVLFIPKKIYYLLSRH